MSGLDPTTIGNATLYCGDCLEVMAGMKPDSVDAIVTDPPAGIAFMGKKWDSDKGGRAQWIAWMETVAAECLRVLKPGGHALVWAIPRTSHWTGMAWENAGWEPRDKIYHCFGSGFPKSLAIDKALDRMAGAEREVVGPKMRPDGKAMIDARPNNFDGCHEGYDRPWKHDREAVVRQASITAPSTPAAKQWSGWGTALKPAIEEWWLFRKPPIGTIAQNVLRYGTGGLNVDGCRVGMDGGTKAVNHVKKADGRLERWDEQFRGARNEIEMLNAGRYPANLIHSGEPEVVELFPVTGPSNGIRTGGRRPNTHEGYQRQNKTMYQDKTDWVGVSDSGGSAARFFQCCPFEAGDYDPLFYTGKATKSDRNSGIDGTCTVKYNIDKSITGDLSCKDVSTVLAALLKKVTSEKTATWNIGESGESITGRCQSVSLSTTLTAISRITPSEILSLLTPSLISECIVGANCETENGGNLAANAGKSKRSQRIITNENQVELARGVNLVVSKMLSTISDGANWKPGSNFHSTVKPLSLCRYLVRLVTPPNGLILDPFAGSGSTGKAALLEGFRFVGIDLEPEHVAIAKVRMEHIQCRQGLFADAT